MLTKRLKTLLHPVFALLTTLALGAAVAWLFASAEPLQPSWDTAMFDGEGTKEAPFIIATPQDFSRFRDLVNKGDAVAWCHFKQTEDIDLSSVGSGDFARRPIGILGSGYVFHGDYDGNGHVLNDLAVIDNDFAGLFGELCGTVRNLGIQSGLVQGNSAGGIAYYVAGDGCIVNCFNAARVLGTTSASGISCVNDGEVLHCWNVGQVFCNGLPGAGIVSQSRGQVKSCVSVGLPVDSSLTKGQDIGAVAINSVEEAFGTRALRNAEQFGYLLDPSHGNIGYAIAPVEGGLSFVRLLDPSSGFLQDVVTSLLVSHVWLVVLLVAAIAFVVVCLAKKAYRARSTEANQDDKDEESGVSRNPKGWRVVGSRALGIFVFALLLGGGYALASRMVDNKEIESKTMHHYYDQPADAVDVLLVGSSRIGWNCDGAHLWREYGISSYGLWAGFQPYWNSYYNIQEAVRTNRPKAVVLEVRASVYSFEFNEAEHQSVNTTGIANPITKLQSVRASSSQDSWLDLATEFPLFHSRFSMLEQRDFATDEGDVFKGFYPTYGYSAVQEIQTADKNAVARTMNLKEETYLRGIIQFLKEQNIPLVLVASPAEDYALTQQFYKATEQLARECDTPYLDLNTGEYGFFGIEDYIFDDRHLNTRAARKEADILAVYLKANYGIEDKRTNAYYASWDLAARNYENDYLAIITGTQDWFTELKRDGRQLLLVGHWIDPVEYERFAGVAKKAGAENLVPAVESWQNSEASLWFVQNTSDVNVNAAAPMESYTATLGSHELSYGKNASGEPALLDGTEPILGLGGNSIAAVVYDSTTDELVDVVRFEGDLAFPAMIREGV